MKKIFSGVLLAGIVTGIPLQAQDTLRTTIYFDHNDFLIDTVDSRILSVCLQQLNVIDSAVITLAGHCDATGTAAENLLLSGKRNASVEHFVNTLIDTTRCTVVAEAYGETMPVADNTSETGRSLNRRVELTAVVFRRDQSKTTLRAGQTKLDIPEFVLGAGTTLRRAILQMQPGDHLILRDIQFPLASDTLLPSAFPLLDSLVAVMEEFPEMRMQFEGHVCCTSSSGMVAGHADAYNARTHRYHLSADRALAVYRYVLAKGIDQQRIKYIGYSGTKKLIDPEYTEQDQQLNRRVELKLLAK